MKFKNIGIKRCESLLHIFIAIECVVELLKPF